MVVLQPGITEIQRPEKHERLKENPNHIRNASELVVDKQKQIDTAIGGGRRVAREETLSTLDPFSSRVIGSSADEILHVNIGQQFIGDIIVALHRVGITEFPEIGPWTADSILDKHCE